MTEYFYGTRDMARRLDRAINVAVQWDKVLPEADVVLYSGTKPSKGWSLSTWRDFASSRREPLRTDLLTVIEHLENAPPHRD
ncbi:hypothetical protein ACTXPA_17615 [Glutamicibacter arilaitensis]|uniref:hypothetical protein n=1 Tax=Glutamicibacter arilaitensis TaxID=256701 RepID=UPI003FD4E4FD